MSYTLDVNPDDLALSIMPSGRMAFTFTCPRCGNHVVSKEFSRLENIYGGTSVDVTCLHPSCVAEGERYGYRLDIGFSPSGICLGLNDRPLHDKS